MSGEYENGRVYPKAIMENAKATRERLAAGVHEALSRIEEKQTHYSSRLDTIEHRINTQLETVASNTTSMSRSLEAIQVTNSRLVDIISSRNVVPTVVMVIVIVLLAGIFLTRELAMSGGRAKFSFEGLDISSGIQPSPDFTPHAR